LIAVDLESREIFHNWEIKQRIAQTKPFGEWTQQQRQTVSAEPFGAQPQLDSATLLRSQTAFGYTAEDVEMIIVPMATAGKEPTFCMGDDIPLAVLSDKPRLLYDYFKQRFAQVTNPPIDPLRESLVMSLRTQLGARGNILAPSPEAARLVLLETPIINDGELAAIKNLSHFGAVELSTLYEIASGPEGLETKLNQLCEAAAEAVQAGSQILILSDRAPHQTISATHSYIPPLMAVGAVHHHLIRSGLRLKASIVVDTAQCWSTHHFACLIGYGASAICPYMALETVRQWWNEEKTQKLMARGKIEKSTSKLPKNNIVKLSKQAC
jgi:glutamate synthase (ferredoxin)